MPSPASYHSPIEPVVVELDQAFNFRDLGGYHSLLGGVVKYGQVYRSDDLSRLTQDDLSTLTGRNVTCVIDLRTIGERQERGDIAGRGYTGRYLSIPLLDVSAVKNANAPGADYLERRYRQILTEGAPQIARIITLLAHNSEGASVFHCAVGKDRTGVVAMVLLGLLGVHQDEIIHDYQVTQIALAKMIIWLEDEHPEIAKRVKEIPSVIMAADPATMSETLKWMTDTFGTFDHYAAFIGVPVTSISMLREKLLG